MSIPLPIPFFKHPSIVWRGLKYTTLFSLSRISYFFNMCDMSQPQFLLFPPKSDRGLLFKTLFSFIMYHISSTCVMSQPQFLLFPPKSDRGLLFKTLFSFIMYHISSNTWVGPFPCLPFCSPKYFPTHSICCFSHRFPFLKTKCYPPPSLNICCHME